MAGRPLVRQIAYLPIGAPLRCCPYTGVMKRVVGAGKARAGGTMNGHLFEVERLVRHRQDTIARDVVRAQGLDSGGRRTLRERLVALMVRSGNGAATVAGAPRPTQLLEAGAGD